MKGKCLRSQRKAQITGLIEENQLGMKDSSMRLGEPLMAHNTDRVQTLSRKRKGAKRGTGLDWESSQA